MGKHQNAPNLNALLGEGDIPDDAIYYPEYDKAIVGFTTKGHVVYDVDACVQVLVDDNDMGYEEATEYFWFNTEGAHFGNMTPVFINLRGNFSGQLYSFLDLSYTHLFTLSTVLITYM